jgi:Uma2 family endonuclease
MAGLDLDRLYTPEEYLAYERQAPNKHEYIAGKIVPMGDAGDEHNLARQIVATAGAGRRHNLITGNLLWVLMSQLRERAGEVYASLMRVKGGAGTVYIYPAIAVVCEPPQFEDADTDTLLNPTLIIEVLSPATEGYDRGDKFGYYRALPSVQEYLLVAQDKPLVEQFVRADTSWVYRATTDPAAVVRLPSIGCDLPLAEVYRKVVFPTDAEAAAPVQGGNPGAE